MLLDCGDRVIERYGASSTAGAAARANYLVKWESIRTSRDRGMARYDMWGTDHEGVATFKASFGGYERQYIGAWELVTNRAASTALRRHRAPARPAAPDRLAAGASRRARGRRCGSWTSRPRRPTGWDARRGGRARRARDAGHAWADHRRSQGADPRFVTFSDGHGVLVTLRHQPLSPGSIATVRRGPAHAGGTGADLAAHIGCSLAAAMTGHRRPGAVRGPGARCRRRRTRPPWMRWVRS